VGLSTRPESFFGLDAREPDFESVAAIGATKPLGTVVEYMQKANRRRFCALAAAKKNANSDGVVTMRDKTTKRRGLPCVTRM
jgi:hypothetical protein